MSVPALLVIAAPREDFPLRAFVETAAQRRPVVVLPSAALPQAPRGARALPPFDGDGEKLLAAARKVFTEMELAAVVLADPALVEDHFAALRHLAGADQSLVCLFPDAERLRRPAASAAALASLAQWRETLAAFDDVWAVSEEDAAACRAVGREPALMPRFAENPAALGPWLDERLAGVREKTKRLASYGGPEDLASLVIPTYNDGELLKRCLDSVKRHTAGPHEIIVVDNGTTNGSTAFLDGLPGVKTLRQERNLYFAAGCNAGLRAAKGEHLVLLNADVAVTPGWLERLVRRAKRDASVGLAGPYTNAAAGAQRVENPGYPPDGLDAFAEKWAKDREGGRLYVPRLDGFCLLVKRRVLDAVGLLDERFGPGGYEDYDYCLRARQAGFRLLLAEEVYVHHEGGAAYAGTDYDAARRRNREIFVDKWCRRSLGFLDEVW